MLSNGSSETLFCAILESFVFNYLKQLVEVGVRKMSLNRRRWSNELLDSLIDFQKLENSLNKNEEKCPVDASNDKTNDNTPGIVEVSSADIVEEFHDGSMPALMLSSSDTSCRGNYSSNILNLTMTENDERKDCGNYTYLNNKIVENVTESSDGTARFFSCDSEIQSVRSQSSQCSCEIFHEVATFEGNVIEHREKSNCENNDSHPTNEVCSSNKIGNRHSLNLMSFDNKQDAMCQRYFSSPVEFPNLDKEKLGDINHPDIWDALMELDEVLSPFEGKVNTPEENKPKSVILSRLSQKFKKTPSRFTEKLISILEDSVLSTESPTKHQTNTSGISLHRMTGEFRKLCKFIEDESMPEWAPSMMNITTFCNEKTETPESENAQKNGNFDTPKKMIRRIQDTPTLRSSPLALKAFLTPKNKIRSRNQTPIKQFTPSADKSFEYWEKICNMMCDPSSAEKLKRKTPIVQEGPKLSMDDMLTICERQMASLDDSTVEFRTCNKTEPCSSSKIKILQTPRSKSVSEMYGNCEKRVKSSSKKKADEKVEDKVQIEEQLINLDDTINDTVLMSDSDTTSNDSSFLRRRVLNIDDQEIRVNEQNSFDYDYELLRKPKSPEHKSFENDFKLIDYNPQGRQSKTQSEISYDPDDPDCSILAELALRRQRCLETAKLMMEIDQEDPMTADDNKCVETLYKLGIQDKTFAEIEEDTKFLTTLNQCLEYRNYFSEKSKPIIKALQKIDTPELKKRTAPIIRSQSHLSARKPSNKSTLPRTKSAMSLHDKKMTPRLAPSNAASKVTPRINRTSSLRATPKISTTTPRVSAITPRAAATTPRVSATTPRVSTMTPRVMTTTPRPLLRSVSKLTPQGTRRNMHSQSEQSQLTHKLPTKTPQSLQKPLLRRPILRLSPKTTRKLTPPSELKPCTPRPAQKSTPQSDLKPFTPRQAQKLTPRSELKPFTPRPAQKLTPPFETNVVTSKPTPKRVANLKSTSEINSPAKTISRPRFFLSPGHSPSVAVLGRKKPASYFSQKNTETHQPLTSQNLANEVKSPIGLYINSVDNDLIQNVHAKTNDRLLTPVSYGEDGKSPKLKVNLASKENKSPRVHCDENIVLPTVRYQSAKNVCLIDNKSNYSPISMAPNSKTKKMLESIENTVVIRHEGRIIEPCSKTNFLDTETSIRIQKVAEKTTPLRRKME